MDGSSAGRLATMWCTHLDNLLRAQFVQDVCKVSPALLDSKPDPGKVERGKATRRDTLGRKLTGSRERDTVIVSQHQYLCGQAHIAQDLTVGLIPFGRHNLRHDIQQLGSGAEQLGDDQ